MCKNIIHLIYQLFKYLSGISLVVDPLLPKKFSAQIDTAHTLEGWREKYSSADDATKLECDPSSIIQLA